MPSLGQHTWWVPSKGLLSGIKEVRMKEQIIISSQPRLCGHYSSWSSEEGDTLLAPCGWEEGTLEGMNTWRGCSVVSQTKGADVKAVPETEQLCWCSTFMGNTVQDERQAAVGQPYLSLNARKFFISETLKDFEQGSHRIKSGWFNRTLICAQQEGASFWWSRCVFIELLYTYASSSRW